MKTTEVNKNLIGRRCECIFTGMMVTGVIEDIEENKYSYQMIAPLKKYLKSNKFNYAHRVRWSRPLAFPGR